MPKSRLPTSPTKPLAFSLDFSRSQKHAGGKYLVSASIAVLAIGAFFLFKRFIYKDADTYGQEIAAAILGTVLTIALTWFLLKHQTYSEVDRQRSIKIYETKLAIYQKLLERIEGTLEDENLTTKEFFQLQLAFQEVVFIAGPRVLNELPAFAYVLASIDRRRPMGEDSKKRILHAFGSLAAEVRADLHDPQPPGQDIGFDVESVLARIEANFSGFHDLSSGRNEVPGEVLGRVEQALSTNPPILGQLSLHSKFGSLHLRNGSSRIVLSIHPDSATPSKIFSDNLNPRQRDAAREILHSDAWENNTLSRWTFTMKDITFEQVMNLIQVLDKPPAISLAKAQRRSETKT